MLHLPLRAVMTDAIAALFLSVFAAALGGLITRWWDRARALVVLRGFVNIVADGDINCSDSLRQLTSRSWTAPKLAVRERGERVHEAHVTARVERCRCEEGAEQVPRFRAWLASTESDEEIVAVLKEMLHRSEFADALVEAVKRSLIRSPAEFNVERQKVEVSFDDKHCNGRYLVAFSKLWGESIGRDLNDQPSLKAAVDPALNAVRMLDRRALSTTLDSLLPLLKEQAEINQKIASMTRPMLEENSRWMVKAVVINYGSKEMALWPQSTLVVRPPGAGRIRVPCLLESVEDPDTHDRRDIVGVYVLPAGARVTLWAGTVPTQREIERGPTLRSSYGVPNSTAYLVLRVTRKRSFPGVGSRSANAGFADGVTGREPSGWDWVYYDVSWERDRACGVRRT